MIRLLLALTLTTYASDKSWDARYCEFWLTQYDKLSQLEQAILDAKRFKKPIKVWLARHRMRKALEEMKWNVLDQENFESELFATDDDPKDDDHPENLRH